VYSLFALGVVVQTASLITDDIGIINNVFSRFFIPVVFLLSIFGYYVLFKIEAKFKEYIIVGSLFLIVTSLIGAALYYLNLLPSNNHLRDSIFYFGVVVENILFTLGLAHQQKNTIEEKNRIILEDKDRQLTMAIETQEYERARIAQEIHDGVLQKLGGVLLQVRNLVDSYSANNDENALDVIRNLESSNDELRDISHRMMPKSLTELGVVETMEEMLNTSLPYANIKYSFEAFNITTRLPEQVELVLYRVAQELVNNIIKHSQARNVTIQIFKSKNGVVLMIEDDGIGITAEQESSGIGLMNIRNRVEALNGTINFEQAEANGTCVRVKLNL
jgi:signal transduction histidine kinase